MKIRWNVFAVILLGALASVLLGTTEVNAQDGRDIYLIQLKQGDDGAVSFGVPRNVTRRVGYDNQPFFLADSRGLYFTSFRPGGFVDEDGNATEQAEIYRYDIEAGRVLQVTDTPESEYSPTPLPGGGFSTVRVDAEGTQQLWEFDAEGRNPQLILTDVTGIGYHAWVGSNELVLFVLGEPHALHRAGRGRAGSVRAAVDIGRALHSIPGREAWSFTQQLAEEDWWIRSIELAEVGEPGTEQAEEEFEIADIAPAYDGVQDYTWTPWETIWLARGGSLFEWDPSVARPEWRRLHDFTANGLADISRLDVSPDGSWLAVVVLEPPVAVVEDVASIDAIVAALYDVISGPAGEALDMDRMRSLFSPSAKLVRIEPDGDGRIASDTFTLENWIASFQPLLEALDFREFELGRRIEKWGHIAQVWSAYEAQSNTEGGERRRRGINTIQLRNDGERWWIESIVFEGDREDQAVPVDLGGNG